MKVYIASPLGFSLATRGFYKTEVLEKLRDAGLTPLDPWDDPDADREFKAALALPLGEARRDALRAINARLGAQNAASIEQADVVLAILDGTDVDSGTAAEIGYAAALKKPVLGIRFDTRQTGDNEGATINLQVEWFIGRGRLVSSIEDAVELLGSPSGK